MYTLSEMAALSRTTFQIGIYCTLFFHNQFVWHKKILYLQSIRILFWSSQTSTNRI